MFDLNRRYDRPYNLPPIQIKHVHSSLSYQQVVINRLVGMALKSLCTVYCENCWFCDLSLVEPVVILMSGLGRGHLWLVC